MMETHWPPVLIVHGVADTTVSASNAGAAALIWADAAGARSSEPRLVRRGKRYPGSVTDFKHHGSTVAPMI